MDVLFNLSREECWEQKWNKIKESSTLKDLGRFSIHVQFEENLKEDPGHDGDVFWLACKCLGIFPWELEGYGLLCSSWFLCDHTQKNWKILNGWMDDKWSESVTQQLHTYF